MTAVSFRATRAWVESYRQMPSGSVGARHVLQIMIIFVAVGHGRLPDLDWMEGKIMTEVTVELNEAELAEAQALFGTESAAETLREAIRRALRQGALTREFSAARAEQYAELQDRDALWR